VQRDHNLLAAFLALVATLLLAGCGLGESGGRFGGGGVGGGTTQPATLVLFIEDQAADNVLAFQLTVTAATLTDSTGKNVSVLPAPVPVEFASRSLAPTVLSITDVPTATYTQLELLVAMPRLAVSNPSTARIEVYSPILTTSAVTLPINLALSAGQVFGARLDFDLRNSVVSNTQVTPRFSFVPTSFVVGQLPGDIDDALGSVLSLDTANNRFTMRLAATGVQITVVVNAATIFEGVVSSLAGLRVGDRGELDARLQNDGTFLALAIEVENQLGQNQVRGLVVVRDNPGGDATRLTLLVLEENPAQLDLDPTDQFTFSIDASTAFRINREDLTVFGLNFDRQVLSPGQVVAVERDLTRAAQITLKQGTITGRVEIIGLTTFDFAPLSGFFAANGLPSIRAVTAPQVEFENLPRGMASVARDQIVAVRGLLLFEFGQPRLITKRVRLLAP